MGRQTAADVVAARGSAVIIGLDPVKVDDTEHADATLLVNAAGAFVPTPFLDAARRARLRRKPAQRAGSA